MLNPNDFFNTFPYISDTLKADIFDSSDYISYFNLSIRGWSAITMIDPFRAHISGGSLDGFKKGQTVTIIDEVNSLYKLAVISDIDIGSNDIILLNAVSNITQGMMSVYIQTRELYLEGGYNTPSSQDLTTTNLLPQPENNSSLLQLNTSARSIFRYPYVPVDTKNHTPFGLNTERSRSDVKTFSSNVSVSWDIVVQDTIIEESFPNMHYEFFHIIYNAYISGNLIGYKARDLNLNMYVVEIISIDGSKMHRFWIDDVKIKFKVHKVINDFGFVPELSKL